MPITYLVGDATDPKEISGPKILVHIVNSVGGFGAGFVIALRNRWKKTETVYRKWYRKGSLDDIPFELGNVLYVKVANDIHVAHMIAQEGYGDEAGNPPIRYEALKSCLQDVAACAKEMNASIIGPRFGAGLSGGDWFVIEQIINDTMPDLQVYIYDLPEK